LTYYSDTQTGRDIVGVIGPLLFVTFVSDESGVGQGFLLEYFAFGYNEATGYTYAHAHLDSPTGNVVWPDKPAEYFMNAFSTFTITPQLPDSRRKLTVDTVDLISLLRGCQNNFLVVHQLFEGGLVLRLRHVLQNKLLIKYNWFTLKFLKHGKFKTLYCRYCEPDLFAMAEISSSSPLLIIYRAAVGPKNVGISFSWEEFK